MPVLTLSNLPIADRSRAWDSSAAEKRLRKAAGGSSNTEVNFSQYKRNFLWSEVSNPDRFEQLKFPYVDVVNGQRMIIPRAIFAMTTGGRGVDSANIPASDKAGIKREVNKAYKKISAKFKDPGIVSPFLKEVGDEEPETTPVDMAVFDSMVDLQKEYRTKAQEFLTEYYEKLAGIYDQEEFSFSCFDKKKLVGALNRKLWDLWFMFEEINHNIMFRAEPIDLSVLVTNASREYTGRIEKAVSEFEADMAQLDSEYASESSGESLPSDEEKSGMDILKRIIKEVISSIPGLVVDPPPDESHTPEENKSEDSENAPVTLLKGQDGKTYLYGRMTNNIMDRDSQALTDSAHKDYIAWLDQFPNAAPSLQTWHTPGTDRTHKANWWDYSDGFVHMTWPLEPDEVKGVEDFMKEWTPGMSHGFFIYEITKDQKLILKYRTFEGSLLPVENAANIYTSFGLLPEISKEKDTMFTEAKRRVLIAMHGEEAVKRLEQASEKDAQTLDKIPVQRKEGEATVTLGDMIKDQVSLALADAIVLWQEKQSPSQDIAQFLKEMEGNLVKALDIHMQNITELTSRVASLEAGQTLVAKQQPPQTIDGLAAWLAKNATQGAGTQSALPPAKKEDGNDADHTGPVETPHKPVVESMLGGLLERFPGPKTNGQA